MLLQEAWVWTEEDSGVWGEAPTAACGRFRPTGADPAAGRRIHEQIPKGASYARRVQQSYFRVLRALFEYGGDLGVEPLGLYLLLAEASGGQSCFVLDLGSLVDRITRSTRAKTRAYRLFANVQALDALQQAGLVRMEALSGKRAWNCWTRNVASCSGIRQAPGSG